MATGALFGVFMTIFQLTYGRRRAERQEGRSTTNAVSRSHLTKKPSTIADDDRPGKLVAVARRGRAMVRWA